MGTLVTFESHGLLLQREDFPGALRALQKIAKTVPGFFRDEKAVRTSKDLMTALRAGEFPAEVDAYGDVIGIRYIGDKWPPGGPDDFPEHLVFGLAKFLRKASFHLWVEGVPGVRKFWVERGKVHSHQGRRSQSPGRVARAVRVAMSFFTNPGAHGAKDAREWLAEAFASELQPQDHHRGRAALELDGHLAHVVSGNHEGAAAVGLEIVFLAQDLAVGSAEDDRVRQEHVERVRVTGHHCLAEPSLCMVDRRTCHAGAVLRTARR
jgi:hypothetical protein